MDTYHLYYAVALTQCGLVICTKGATNFWHLQVKTALWESCPRPIVCATVGPILFFFFYGEDRA